MCLCVCHVLRLSVFPAYPPHRLPSDDLEWASILLPAKMENTAKGS